MAIGYKEQVNKIIITTNDGRKMLRQLGCYGLNILGKNYSYYDKYMHLHVLNMNHIKEIKLYNDKTLINVI